MTRAADLKTINCTSCGAGLSVHGGGRVECHICTYCGAQLDAHDNYKMLAKFEQRHRPDSPFEIGMSGKIEGVDFTIIGTLGVEEKSGGVWRWAEHQLFSPTHGYAWLSVEDGHLVFTRKVRGMAQPGWITERQVNMLESRPSASFRGDVYTYYECSTPVTAFAEGEFNWTPGRRDRSNVVSFVKDDRMLSYVDNGRERELELSKYLPHAETLAAFGAEAERPTGVHPMQPYQGWREEGFQRMVAIAGFVVCLVLAIAASAGGSETLRQTQLAFSQLPKEIPLTVRNAGALVEIQFSTNVDNSWAAFDLEVSDTEDEVLFAASRGMEYYHGYQDGYWSEGSRDASLTFRAPAAGEYKISLDRPESVADWGGGRAASVLMVRAIEGTKASFWLWIATALFGVWALAASVRRFWHNRRRMAGSDWVDEDDDDD